MTHLDMTILYVADPLTAPISTPVFSAFNPSTNHPASPCSSCRMARGSACGRAPTSSPTHPTAKAAKSASRSKVPTRFAATHADWSKRMSIAQVPTEMDFGNTFVALDPDGYRLRVFSPSQR